MNSQMVKYARRFVISLVIALLALPAHSQAKQDLVVLVKPIPPFVKYEDDGSLTGFSIDLWRALGKQAGFTTTYKRANTLTELLDGIEIASADAAIAAVTINSEREKRMDFSHTYFHSGLQVLVRSENAGIAGKVWATIVSILSSPTFLTAIFIFFAGLLVAAHIIWMAERRRNPQFAKSYLSGIWDSFWWSLVTVTTVGYGDKTPKTHTGRAFAILWIVFGYLGFAWFTAIVTSTVTVSQLTGNITGPDSLANHRVGTVRSSTSARWLRQNVPGARILVYDNIGRAYDQLLAKDIDAVVYDAPSVLYFTANRGKGLVRPAGPVFHQEEYGIAFPSGSPLREKVNRALLVLYENGTYKQIYTKWFGATE